VDKRRWLERLSIGVHYTTKEDDMRLVDGICAGVIWMGELFAGFSAQTGPRRVSKPNVNRKTHTENRGWGTLRVVLSFSGVGRSVLVNFFVNFKR
jgi:hypothetical protein